MPKGTRDIQRRLRSVGNTRKITKAMELVASAKVRKASQAVLATRPYANEAWTMLLNLAASTDPAQHPLLHFHHQPKTIGLVLVSSSRGLVGSFNTNIIKATVEAVKAKTNVKVVLMGAKGKAVLQQPGFEALADFVKDDVITNVLQVRPMSKLVTDQFISHQFDEVFLAYMDFVSTLVQKPVVRQLLPIMTSQAKQEVGNGRRPVEYLFEPNPDDVLEYLLPRLVEMQLYRAVLETNASEQAARMVAMKNASEAASDLIDDLTLTFNQARQAAITQDLAEISAGRAALES